MTARNSRKSCRGWSIQRDDALPGGVPQKSLDQVAMRTSAWCLRAIAKSVSVLPVYPAAASENSIIHFVKTTTYVIAV